MGGVQSYDEDENSPPPPTRSTVFVVRNGRYEPQNFMPVLPRPDMFEFDGFVLARRGRNGGTNVRPPEMRSAKLLKNPVSVRRDSIALSQVDDTQILSFVFDAVTSGQLSVHLLVKAERQGEEVDSIVKLVPELPPKYIMSEESQEPDPFLVEPITLPPDSAVEVKMFEPGLCQVFRTQPLGLSRWPTDCFTYDPAHPAYVPVAICLTALGIDGGQAVGSALKAMTPHEIDGAGSGAASSSGAGTDPGYTHFTYVSLQHHPADKSDTKQEDEHWSARIQAQKWQDREQHFELHEVFGISSTKASVQDVESGNSECVICLSEPRDTAVLPCRHLCFCSYCAGIVRLQCEKCPVCRQKVQSLLQLKHDDDKIITEEEMELPFATKSGGAGSSSAAAALLDSAGTSSSAASAAGSASDYR